MYSKLKSQSGIFFYFYKKIFMTVTGYIIVTGTPDKDFIIVKTDVQAKVADQLARDYQPYGELKITFEGGIYNVAQVMVKYV